MSLGGKLIAELRSLSICPISQFLDGTHKFSELILARVALLFRARGGGGAGVGFCHPPPPPPTHTHTHTFFENYEDLLTGAGKLSGSDPRDLDLRQMDSLSFCSS